MKTHFEIFIKVFQQGIFYVLITLRTHTCKVNILTLRLNLIPRNFNIFRFISPIRENIFSALMFKTEVCFSVFFSILIVGNKVILNVTPLNGQLEY